MNKQQATAEQYEVKAGLDKVQSFSVIGLSAMITAGQDGAAEQINMLWSEFFAQKIGFMVAERTSETIYAVYSDYQGDHTKPYRLTIGYRIPEDTIVISDDLYRATVRSGDYAMMSAQGEQPKALIETWTAIWQSDLPRKFETDFEIYGPRFFEEGVNEVLVFIGVKVN